MADLKFKWSPVAGNKEIGVSEDGNFRAARMPDWQFMISYRAVPTRPKPHGSIWIKVDGDFDSIDEALEQAQKERKLIENTSGS